MNLEGLWKTRSAPVTISPIRDEKLRTSILEDAFNYFAECDTLPVRNLQTVIGNILNSKSDKGIRDQIVAIDFMRAMKMPPHFWTIGNEHVFISVLPIRNFTLESVIWLPALSSSVIPCIVRIFPEAVEAGDGWGTV